MLSNNYRQKLNVICNKIALREEVSLEDMIWAEKLARANRHAGTMLRQARRKASTPNMQEGDLDDFLNQLDLGDPDPTRHKSKFETIDEIVDFFKRDDLDGDGENWRRRD